MNATRSPDSPFDTQRSPEESILLWAVRGSPGETIPLPPESGRPLDWALLRRLATRHGVFPLLHQKFKSPGGDRVPEATKSEFRRLYMKNAGRNLLLARRLLELLRLFRDNGIEAIPFKGPVLAALAYGNVSLRRFCDLDILVHRQDIEKTADLLRSRGFVPSYRLSGLQRRMHDRFTCELGFVQPEENLHLDIHWRFAARYLAPGFAVIDPFARSRKVPFEGGETATLPGDILLLFLCLHGTFHLWTSLSHVSDIARVVETGGAWDWEKLLKRGEETGLARVLLLGLALAREFCGISLPPVVIDRIGRDRRLERLLRHVRGRLFSDPADLPGFGELAVFHIRSQDRWRGRLRYVFLRLFLPTVEDWKRLPLPDALFFLYFLLRPLRLAGHILFRRGSADPDQST